MANNSSNIPPQLVGFWKVVGGDYPLINEYRADGVLIQHVGDQTADPIGLRVEGEYLVSIIEQPDGSISEDREKFEVSAEGLTFIDAEGEKRHFQRVPKDEQPAPGRKPWWRFW